jgi:hypothetical protein
MIYVVFRKATAAEFHDVRVEVSISKACGHVRDSAINVVAGRLIRGALVLKIQGVPLICAQRELV